MLPASVVLVLLSQGMAWGVCLDLFSPPVRCLFLACWCSVRAFRGQEAEDGTAEARGLRTLAPQALSLFYGVPVSLLARGLGAEIRHLKLQRGLHPREFKALSSQHNRNSCMRATQLQS